MKKRVSSSEENIRKRWIPHNLRYDGRGKRACQDYFKVKSQLRKKAIINRYEWGIPTAPQQMRAQIIWWQPCCSPLGTLTTAYLHWGKTVCRAPLPTQVIWNSKSSDVYILIATLDISVYENKNSESKNATMQESKGKALVQIKIAPSTSHCFSQQQRGHITPLMDQNKECIASSLATSKK